MITTARGSFTLKALHPRNNIFHPRKKWPKNPPPSEEATRNLKPSHEVAFKTLNSQNKRCETLGRGPKSSRRESLIVWGMSWFEYGLGVYPNITCMKSLAPNRPKVWETIAQVFGNLNGRYPTHTEWRLPAGLLRIACLSCLFPRRSLSASDVFMRVQKPQRMPNMAKTWSKHDSVRLLSTCSTGRLSTWFTLMEIGCSPL